MWITYMLCSGSLAILLNEVPVSGICHPGMTHEAELPMKTKKSKVSPRASGLVQDGDCPNHGPTHRLGVEYKKPLVNPN
jgi:hypothetical protein